MAPTTIGPHCHINGRVEGEEDVVLEGRIEGTVVLSEEFTVAEGGFVRGDIDVRIARIEGSVDGSIRASELLLLAPTARVSADLEAEVLVIEDGARFSGDIEMDVEGDVPARTSRTSTGSTSSRTTSTATATSTPSSSTSGSRTTSSSGRATGTSTSGTTTTTTTVVEETEATDGEAEEPSLSMSASEMQEFTVKELREKLRELDLTVSGTKDELIERLQDAEN